MEGTESHVAPGAVRGATRGKDGDAVSNVDVVCGLRTGRSLGRGQLGRGLSEHSNGYMPFSS